MHERPGGTGPWRGFDFKILSVSLARQGACIAVHEGIDRERLGSSILYEQGSIHEAFDDSEASGHVVGYTVRRTCARAPAGMVINDALVNIHRHPLLCKGHV